MLAVLLFALQGCSDRTVTRGFVTDTTWDEAHKPWYIGQPTGDGRYTFAPGAERALIFEMAEDPDHGKISGEGRPGHDIRDVIQSCSRQDMHVEGAFHSSAVIMRSSSADRDTVECVRRLASRSFTVGYGHAGLSDAGETAPFEEFENKAN